MPASFFLFAAFCLGIILAVYFNLWLIFFVLLGLLLLLLSLKGKQRYWLLLFLIFTLSGWLRSIPVLSELNQLNKLAQQKTTVRVQGYVVTEVSPYSYLFQSTFIQVKSKKQPLYTRFLVSSRGLKVFRQQKQLLSGYFVKKQQKVYFLAKKVIWQSREPLFFVRQFLQIKKAVFQLYDRSVAALFMALVFGADEAISLDVKQSYVETGLLHIFAASGFNIALASLSLFYFLKWLKAPKYLALVLALLSLGSYYLLIGPSPSVVRAAIMTALLLLAILVGRPHEVFNLLFLSALLILITSPLALFEVGLQLSYAAVIGLAYFQKRLENLFLSANMLVRSLTTTFAAQLGVLPVQLYYFSQLSLIAPFANLIVLPLVALITIIGFYAAVNLLIFPSLSLFILKHLKVLFLVLAFVVDKFSLLPANIIIFSSPKVAFIASLIFLLALIVLEQRFQNTLKNKLNLFFILSLLLILVITNFFLAAATKINHPPLEAYFFDVDQGDAALIKINPEATNILIDGGPSYPRLRRYLQNLKLLKIDLLIISHAHADHISSLAGLINRYKIGAVIIPYYQPKSFLYQQLLAKIKQKKLRLIEGIRNTKLKIGSVVIKTFWPQRRPLIATTSDANNNSLVFKLSYKQVDFLLMGDAQLEAINKFVSNSNLQAEVLKVSHQGSFNGTNKTLLKKVNPQIAIIFVAADNPYGHPHKSTLTLLKKFRLKIFRTDKNGTISIFSNGYKLAVSTEK